MYKFIISILFFCIGLSLDTDWQTYGNHEVSLNSIIIEFKDDYAPSLGLEPPLDFTQVTSLNTLEKSSNFKSLEPLFNSYNSFTQLHRDHNLHKYYRLTFNEPQSNLLSLIDELKSLSIVENVEFNYKMEAFLAAVLFKNKYIEVNKLLASPRFPLEKPNINSFFWAVVFIVYISAFYLKTLLS